MLVENDLEDKAVKFQFGHKFISSLNLLLCRVEEPPKILRMQSVNPADYPPSYTSNSPDEQLVLEYVENFRRQFVQL